ncbi:coiled-coil domain-containing protein R3HCC1L-like, partial [Bacillus rossius redtenbacheri]|uniref:coiled-coil domain-containing protein R3HCC1L-like n=1 Tax=Bacillus rossius redtenbacheri TaxID=93214 RepID=UPI002FDD6118
AQTRSLSSAALALVGGRRTRLEALSPDDRVFGAGPGSSVLVFPPVNNYRRFLIHKVCEESAKELQTFSIGQGHGRRTVVCFKELLIREPESQPVGYASFEQAMGVDRHLVAPVDCPTPAKLLPAREGCVKKAKSLPTIGIYRPPAARRLEAPPGDHTAAAGEEVTPTAPAKSEKPRSTRRRPDIQVYVPRAKRALICDLPSQNADSGGRSPARLERRSSSSSQKQGSDSDVPCSRTEQLAARPPEDEDKLSCNEVSNKETGRSRKLQRRPPSVRKLVRGDEPSASDEKLSNGSSSYNLMLEDGARLGIPEDALLRDIVQDTDCQKPVEKNDVPLPVNSVTCDPLRGETSLEDDRGENSPASLKNGFEITDVPSPARPSSKERNETMKQCNREVEQELNSDDLQSSTRVTQQTELRNTLQCLDITGDGVYGSKKKDGEDEECRKEENRRTRRILRRNFISDVLIISETQVQLEPQVVSPKSKNDGSSREEETCLPEKSATRSEIVAQEENLDDTMQSDELSKLNPEECTWDMMFDDNGECLDPKLMEELTRAVGSVTIEKPQSDYRNYQSRLEMFMSGSGDEFAHVVEIYNFPAEFKTEDLLSVFSAYKNGGFEIKWVDDTHALGVFSSSRVAAEVLAQEHPLVKTRPLSQATHESRSKARRAAEFLQPYRARPETCAALARRLVTGALGVRLCTSREEREAERLLLREAREKKRLAAKQREAAWEGTFSEHNKTV